MANLPAPSPSLQLNPTYNARIQSGEILVMYLYSTKRYANLNRHADASHCPGTCEVETSIVFRPGSSSSLESFMPAGGAHHRRRKWSIHVTPSAARSLRLGLSDRPRFLAAFGWYRNDIEALQTVGNPIFGGMTNTWLFHYRNSSFQVCPWRLWARAPARVATLEV